MFITVTLRNVGTATTMVGLLIAVITLGTITDRPFALAWLLVIVGIGLRLEAQFAPEPHRARTRPTSYRSLIRCTKEA